MKLYAGIDLHSSNSYIGVIDENDKRHYSKRHYNNMNTLLKVLKPFKKNLQGVVVESTYNWYWLVDGLQEQGYKVHLANPAAIKQYDGLKHTDDKSDSFWLAHLLRLNILPEGYIYPKEKRALRDLLRRRLRFVKHRTSTILSLQSMLARQKGFTTPGSLIKTFNEGYVEGMFECPNLTFAAKADVAEIQNLNEIIKSIEKEVWPQVQLAEEFEHLLTVPGIGEILGMTIMLEVGDINRFKKVGNYGSYCRCVKSERISNKKKKGVGNRKNGNRYLAWAYVEAAHHCVRNCERARKFYQRKKARTNGAVATKALANKLARASYYIMRDQVSFDEGKLFQ
jgi:transposase